MRCAVLLTWPFAFVDCRLQDDVGESGWCDSFKVSTAGQKVEISLKGSQVGWLSGFDVIHSHTMLDMKTVDGEESHR
jgi:hypothetical protein